MLDLRLGSRFACGAVGLTLAALAAAAAGGCSSNPANTEDAPSSPVAASATALPAGYSRLSRGVHYAARPENDRGPLDPAKRIANLSLAFKLSPSQLADREALKDALVDPTSPHFRQFLTPGEYATRFGAAPAVIARTKSWLAGQGLEVHEDSPLAARVTFSGTVGALEAAFHTEMRQYAVRGVLHYSMSTPPALPKDIAAEISDISNTHDFYPKPMLRGMHAMPDYTPTGAKEPSFAPPDWENVYNASPLYTTGIAGSPVTGAGVTIAIVGVADIADSDVAAWRKLFNVPASTLTHTLVPNTGASAGGSGGAGFEAVLDVEWSGAIAPGAQINLVHVGANDGNVDDATFYAIEQNIGGVLNESFGGCEGFYTEAGYSGAYQNLIDTYASAANVLGITYMAASGDQGVALCDAEGGPGGMYVSVPASYPGITAVGGTQFAPGTVSGSPYFAAYSTAETVWNESSPKNPLGGGGGVSVLFSRPSYQMGLQNCAPLGSLPDPSIVIGNQRQVPDVAFTSATGSFNETIGLLALCTINPNTMDCSTTGGSKPSFGGGGGTSFASPSFSGVVALMSQVAKGRLGNINPLLYELATTTPTAFHDIATGSNETNCSNKLVDGGAEADPGCPAGGSYGYPATTGYDCASGLGSLNIYNAVAAVAGMTATATSLQIAPTMVTTPTEPVLFTATVTAPQPSTNTNSLDGVVSFAFESTDAMGMIDLTWTLGTTTITNGSPTTGTATFMGAVPPGLVKPGMQSVNVYADYGGDATHLPSQSAAVTLAFAPITTFVIAPAAPTVAPNGNITFTVNGGTAPYAWYTGNDTTCDMAMPPNCATIVPATGVYTAGPVAGTTVVGVVDAKGIEATTTVNVVCTPAKCTAADCGTISDGCGNMINCPSSCVAPQTCGGGGVANTCGCTPQTACPASAVCGEVSDGCTGMLPCGTCPTGLTCTGNACVAAPTGSSSSSSASGGTGGETGTSSSEASTSAGSGSTSSGGSVTAKGCSCLVAGDSSGDSRGALGLLGMAGLLVGRSRRRRSWRAVV